jgi:hypothetical protein
MPNHCSNEIGTINYSVCVFGESSPNRCEETRYNGLPSAMAPQHAFAFSNKLSF